MLAGVTFFLFQATAHQFFQRRFLRIATLVAGFQFAAASVAALISGSFLVVILNYAPVLLLLFVLNLQSKKYGSGWITAGILLLFAASAIQAAGVDIWTPLDRNGLFHLISMIGVFCLFRGGECLREQ